MIEYKNITRQVSPQDPKAAYIKVISNKPFNYSLELIHNKKALFSFENLNSYQFEKISELIGLETFFDFTPFVYNVDNNVITLLSITFEINDKVRTILTNCKAKLDSDYNSLDFETSTLDFNNPLKLDKG